MVNPITCQENIEANIVEKKPKLEPMANFQPPMPWFGLDIGGSLVKLVFFEPDHPAEGEEELAKKLRHYLTNEVVYGKNGRRDSNLECRISLNGIAGRLHFIRFPTSRMHNFLMLAKEKGFSRFSSTVCTTGGGSHKYETEIKKELKLDFYKFDELKSVLSGLHLLETHVGFSECYTFENAASRTEYRKVPFQIKDLYPYLVVNIGSGVSIISVTRPGQYKRISGSSIGGGTFLGICTMLTGCENYDEAVSLASKGDYTKVDKRVCDIYGGDYSQVDLPGDVLASSFGHMIDAEKRTQVSKEDLAASCLIMVTNNITQIAMMCAAEEKIERIVFLGSFMRVNCNGITARTLAAAMDFWSGGKLKAMFMEHEGYFGAIGCLQELLKNGVPKTDDN